MTLLLEVDFFGLTIYGDGATIKSVPLINILAARPNNPFALLDIVDCTTHLQNQCKKDALFIAEMILPLIKKMENTRDICNKKHMDLVLMDGVSNVQKGARILVVYYPRITVGHCAAHLVSLFVKDVYTQCPLFFNLHQFAKWLRNMFGSCRHALHAIFKKYTKLHNRGLHFGFIKDTDARMAGAHITLCRVLQLKNALRATINSPEFITLKQFKAEISILQSEDFWNYLFSMCRALYAPMHLLRFADQKVAAMDKMHFYVCQTDANMSYYLSKAVVDSGRCTHEENADHPHELCPRSDPLVVFQGSEAA